MVSLQIKEVTCPPAAQRNTQLTEHQGQRESLEMQHPWAPFECFVCLSLTRSGHMGSHWQHSVSWSTTSDPLNTLKFDYTLSFVLMYSSCSYWSQQMSTCDGHHLFEAWRIAISLGSHMVGSGCTGRSFCISCPTASCIPLGGSCLELSDLCPCQGPGYIGDTGTVPTFRKQKAPEACPCAPAETQQIREILEAIRASHVRPFRLRCWYVTDVRPFPYGQCETLGFISWKMLKVATSIEFHGDGRKIQMVWILDGTTWGALTKTRGQRDLRIDFKDFSRLVEKRIQLSTHVVKFTSYIWTSLHYGNLSWHLWHCCLSRCFFRSNIRATQLSLRKMISL